MPVVIGLVMIVMMVVCLDLMAVSTEIGLSFGMQFTKQIFSFIINPN